MKRGRIPSLDYLVRYRSWLDHHPEVKRRIAQFINAPAPVAPKVCPDCKGREWIESETRPHWRRPCLSCSAEKGADRV